MYITIEVEVKIPKVIMDGLLHEHRILRNVHRLCGTRYTQQSLNEPPILKSLGMSAGKAMDRGGCLGPVGQHSKVSHVLPRKL